jgi:hypothetical protein
MDNLNRLYFKYDNTNIKENMDNPAIPESIKADITKQTASSSNKPKNTNQTDASSNSYLLPASYILPVINETSTLLENSEFNMLRIVINRIKKVDPKLTNSFDISAIIRLQIETPQYTDIINNKDMTIKQKIQQIEKVMVMELNVVSEDAYKKNPYYSTNKSIFTDLIERNSVSSQPKPKIANTTLK